MPLTVPETQCFNALFRKKFFPCCVPLDSFGQTVLETVQFDRQLGVGTIKIQNVPTDRVLPAEFETGKPSSAQCPPKLLLFVRLVAAKLAGDLFKAHGGRMRPAGKISSPPAKLPTLLAKRGEGRGEE